ncbi:MAG: UDP-N-acetylmuramate--L-alanine ligase [Acidimicrobiia bacterium]
MRAQPGATIDLSVPRRIHVVGVNGVGMSAVALLLAQAGHDVRGTDLRDGPAVDRARAAGVTVHIGHDASYVDDVDAVCVSTAIPESNIEVAAARVRNIPVLHRSALLGAMSRQARSIGIAGTHGKTTTTSMLALILSEAGFDPSFVIGGEVNEIGTNARWTGSDLFVIEADESDGSFLELSLAAAIVTNVEVDHLDHFGTVDAIHAGFEEYADGVAGPVVVCLDDPGSAALVHGRTNVITYGTSTAARYRLADVSADAGRLTFTIERDAMPLGRLAVPQRGLHNARNATAAVAMAMEMGAPFEAAAAALARFGGVARRFDFRGRHDGIDLVDDYAHLPTEIGAVLEAAATSGDGWKRVVAVFQPNRFSRMAVLSPEYRDSFVSADVAVITDVYPSGERPVPGVTGKLVVDAICEAHPRARVVWAPSRSDLVAFLTNELRAGDVCISMGCGDIAGLPDELLAAWGAP